MLATGVDKIPGQLATVSLQTNPMSIVVIDQNLVPKEYQTLIPEQWQVNKKMIADHVKNTGEIPNGIEVIKDKKSVRIR
jgi:hypothetical protein